MSNRGLPKHKVRKRVVKHGRKLSLRRLLAYVGLSLGALVLAVTVFILVFCGAILNRYGKERQRGRLPKRIPGTRCGLVNWITRWAPIVWSLNRSH